MQKNIRILLITPIQFNESHGNIKEEVVIKTNEIEDDTKIFIPSQWDYLNEIQNTYSDDSDNLFNIYDTINAERNLDLFYYKNFFTKFTFNFNNLEVTLNVELLSDENCNFFIIFDYICKTDKITDIDIFLNEILLDKDIFQNTNCNTVWSQSANKAIDILKSTLKRLNITNYNKSSFKITKDSSYPLIYLYDHQLKNKDKLFFNEENFVQRTSIAEITKDYQSSYLHIGWNYSLISNFPKNINSKLFASIIVLQLHYYQIRFYKKNFQKKIQTIASLSELTEKDLNNFDKLKIVYYKQYLDYRTYRSGLYPKIYTEFKAVESLWHIHEDIQFIDKILEVQNEYILKKFQQSTEKYNSNLNRALALIAFIQIATIYGIFKDFYELEKVFPQEHSIATYVLFTTTLLAFLLVSGSKIKKLFQKLF